MNAKLSERIASLRNLFTHSCDLKLADIAIMISPFTLNPIEVIVYFPLKMDSVRTTVHLVKSNRVIIHNSYLDIELTNFIDTLTNDCSFNQSERLKSHISSLFALNCVSLPLLSFHILK